MPLNRPIPQGLYVRVGQLLRWAQGDERSGLTTRTSSRTSVRLLILLVTSRRELKLVLPGTHPHGGANDAGGSSQAALRRSNTEILLLPAYQKEFDMLLQDKFAVNPVNTSLVQAALLVFLPTATGTRVISPQLHATDLSCILRKNIAHPIRGLHVGSEPVHLI